MSLLSTSKPQCAGLVVPPMLLATADKVDRISAQAAHWCNPAGVSPVQVRSSVRLYRVLGNTGDSGCEAYKDDCVGCGLSLKRSDIRRG